MAIGQAKQLVKVASKVYPGIQDVHPYYDEHRQLVWHGAQRCPLKYCEEAHNCCEVITIKKANDRTSKYFCIGSKLIIYYFIS